MCLSIDYRYDFLACPSNVSATMMRVVGEIGSMYTGASRRVQRLPGGRADAYFSEVEWSQTKKGTGYSEEKPYTGREYRRRVRVCAHSASYQLRSTEQVDKNREPERVDALIAFI